MAFQVIETPHGAEGSEKSIADFDTRHEALITSAKTLRAHLTELSEPDLTARELFDKWCRSGKGYRIQPEDPNEAPFSDIDYARLYVLRLTDDYSHPLFLEVTTIDYLRTVSGGISPEQIWTFWVKAPATYEGDGIENLMWAGAEVLYDSMSQQSMAADGSKYVLRDVKFRAVSEFEAFAAMKADKNSTLYYVQNDGSFSKNVPVNPMTARV